MQTMENENINSKAWFFVMLSLILFVIYSNSFHCGWHLDDEQNILINPNIHMTQISWDSVKKTFHASLDNGRYMGERVYRPVACLTFALNWFFGQNNVVGYHVVNFLIHLCSSFILYLTILLIFKTPVLKHYSQETRFWAASLSTILWAVHPIQVQAVTYIVQRMASLSAMFYILGLYAYLKARFSEYSKKRILCFSFSLVFYFLAIGSKENTVMLPGSIILLELIFFKNIRNLTLKKRTVPVIAGLVVIIFFSLLIILQRDTEKLFSAYSQRPFSLEQRLLTEPHVLIFHLSQFFFPNVSMFSIAHDVQLSTNLFTPFYTLPAIILIIVLIALSLIYYKKQPLFSFACLFFFLNHLIESSILPLELIFEHRNYLPGFFIFLPFALIVKNYMDQLKSKNRLFCFLIPVFIVFFIINTGFATFIRNSAWKTEKSLWLDAMTKAPYLARVHQNYSATLDNARDIKKIFNINQKALALKMNSLKGAKFISYRNMGNAKRYMEEYGAAVIYLNKALKLYPGEFQTIFDLAAVYSSMGNYGASLETMDLIVSADAQFLSLKSFILLKIKQYDSAIDVSIDALKNSSNPSKVFLLMGIAYKLQKKYYKADLFFKKAKPFSSLRTICLINLIENSIYLNDMRQAKNYARQLINNVPFKNIESLLLKIEQKDPMAFPVALKVVKPVLSQQIKNKFLELEKIPL